jgi:RNA polymerase sigma factor (sigma-70 family)
MVKPYFGGTIEIGLGNETDLVVPWNDVARLREDLNELSDDSLIGLVKGGSADAYSVLYDRYRHTAVRLATYFSNPVDAQDIVAETFAQVFDQLRRGQGPKTSFRGYLLTSVRREAGRRAAMRKRVTPTNDLRTIDKPVPFGHGTVDMFERDVVRDAFASLPQRWQTVLWHLDVDGRKPKEVASILGLKPNGVSALAYRAREGLRKAYLEQHISKTGATVNAVCREIRDLFVGMVRGSDAERDEIESHLETCATCSAAYLELEEINTHLGAVSGVVALGLAAPSAAGLISGLFAKSTIAVKSFVAAAGSTAAVIATSVTVTVLDIPMETPAAATPVHAQPFASPSQHEPDRTIGPAADPPPKKEPAKTSSTTGSSTADTAGSQGQGQTTGPSSGPATGPSSSSGGQLPATIAVDGTKVSASVDAAGVKASVSVNLAKLQETQVSVKVARPSSLKAANQKAASDKVTGKVKKLVDDVKD